MYPYNFLSRLVTIKARGQALLKQFNDSHEQLEQAVVELETFKKLQQLERIAIPNRLQVFGKYIIII